MHSVKETIERYAPPNKAQTKSDTWSNTRTGHFHGADGRGIRRRPRNGTTKEAPREMN